MALSVAAAKDRDQLLDRSLDEALLRISELSSTLWRLREAHAPAAARLGAPRCRECRRRWPCRTARLVALPRRAVR